MRHPLLGLCIFFCLGIIAAASLSIPFIILYFLSFLFLILGIIFFRQNIKFHIFILCSVFFLGAAFLINSGVLPDCHIAKLIPYKSDSVHLVGVIDSDPVYQNARVSFVLRVEKVSTSETWRKACGRVLVRAFKKSSLSYGNRLFLHGKLYRPFSFSQGAFNYRNYLRHQGIYLILSIKKDGVIKKLDEDAGAPLKSFSLRIKHRLREIIIKNLSPFSAGVLNALILGDRQDLSSYLLDILMKLGTVHIIAISGFNVGIVAFIVLLVLKIIKIPRKPRYVLTMLLLIVYCILTGASTPVVRATIMAIVLLLGYCLQRETDIYNSLALAAFIILAFNPYQLFEVSFQLSFFSVISIVWLAPKVKSIFPARLDKIPVVGFLVFTFSVSLSAWVGLLPLIAYYFRIISPVTVLANMIIVPYSALITASGFSLIVIGILAQCLAPIFGTSNELFILILVKINSLLLSIPGAYFKLPGVPFVNLLLYYALLAFIINFFTVRPRARQ